MKNVSNESTSQSSVLVALGALRSGTEYRAAELSRRRIGAKAMAAYPQASEEYAAVRLLIGTWNSIAVIARNQDTLFLDKLFESSPVCHMWDALRDAVMLIRRDLGEGYATDFHWLNNKYGAWLTKNKKSRAYRTADCGGMHAMFG